MGAGAEHGYYWITGRVDDVINVSGHRIGSAEVESALVLNPKCAEAAVIGIPHSVKGQGIYAFVTLMDHVTFDEGVRNGAHQVRGLVSCPARAVACSWRALASDVSCRVCLPVPWSTARVPSACLYRGALLVCRVLAYTAEHCSCAEPHPSAWPSCPGLNAALA